MKKMKAITAGALAMTMIIGCTGCGGGKEKTDASGKIKLQWMGIPYFSSSEEGGYAEKLLEEKFGVDIEPIFLDGEAYANRKPIMMSSGEIPDIIYELDPSDCQGDARQKFLAEITYDEIKTNMPEYVAHVNETAPQAWLYPYYDGKNYGVPNMFYSGEHGSNGIWRMDWLKKVGITKVPETIEEFEEAFAKLADADPDGNGVKDTYGLTGEIKASFWCFPEIFGAYGVLPFNWMEKDGKIVYGGTQPEVKEALEVLARWYEKGFLSPEFVTDTVAKTIHEKFKAGKLAYIQHYAENYGLDDNFLGSDITVLKAATPDTELALAKLPVGPEGKRGTFAWGQAGHIISMGRQVAEQPEKKAKIFEIMNAIHKDDDLTLKLSMGEEGVHYRMTNDEKVFEWIGEYDDYENRSRIMASTHVGNAFFCLLPGRPELGNKFTTKRDAEFDKARRTDYVSLYDAFLKTDVVPSTDKYLEDLRSSQLVYFAKIIRGEQPVSYYDEFVNEWNSRGGAEMEENANKTNEIYKGILDQLK